MFTDVLSTIVEQTNGGIGAVLMGYDGIAVGQFHRPVEEIDLSLVAVEYANVLRKSKKPPKFCRPASLRKCLF